MERRPTIFEWFALPALFLFGFVLHANAQGGTSLPKSSGAALPGTPKIQEFQLPANSQPNEITDQIRRPHLSRAAVGNCHWT